MAGLLRAYPQISEHRALYELPMARGHALIASAQESNPWLTRESPGYIAQELDAQD